MEQRDRIGAPEADEETARRIVLALLFVSDEPVTLDQLGLVLTGRNPDTLRAIVDEVAGSLRAEAGGITVEEVGGGFRLATQPDLAPWIRAFFRTRNRSRLSAASIETLAVVAYKQPVTAPEIQEIRGVDPQGAIKTLLDKNLIRISGKKKVVGRPFLYATTREFLIHFGLPSLDELPPIEDFERLAGALASEPVQDELQEIGEIPAEREAFTARESGTVAEEQGGPEGLWEEEGRAGSPRGESGKARKPANDDAEE